MNRTTVMSEFWRKQYAEERWIRNGQKSTACGGKLAWKVAGCMQLQRSNEP